MNGARDAVRLAALPMRDLRRATLPRLASLSTLLALLALGSTARADATWTRHPVRSDNRVKPAAVPTQYVLTHNGFLDPSCVYFLQDDEIVEQDRTIRGPDGSVRETITPCEHTRFDYQGLPVASGSLRSHKGGGGGGTYDGWLESYSYAGSFSAGSNLSTQWVVPTIPSADSGQDIAFFNDFETATSIVQPVLDYSEMPGTWAIEAESLVGNNDIQSTLVAVSPGDTLLGTVVSSACSSAGACTWTITLTDQTTGKSTTQTTKAVTDAVNEVDAAVLESYGVSACNLLPASGVVPFLNNTVTTSAGAAEPETFTFYPLAQNGVNPEVPTNCGFNGTASGNDYTLYFGANPVLPDAGGSSSSGSSSGSSSSGQQQRGGRRRGRQGLRKREQLRRRHQQLGLRWLVERERLGEQQRAARRKQLGQREQRLRRRRVVEP